MNAEKVRQVADEIVGQFRAARLPLSLSLLTRVTLWRLDPEGAGRWRREVEQQIRQTVREGLNEEKGGLPLFPTVQAAYVIKRKGLVQSVSLGEMTRTEIRAKAAELQKMADGVQRHADELYALHHAI